MKLALRRALYGFVLGMAVGNLIAALTGHPNIVSPALLRKAGSLSAALLLQTLGSGVIGAAGMGGTVFYELDRWPLLLIDLLHYAFYMAVFIPVSIFLGWTEKPWEICMMAAILLVLHTIIFVVMCVRYRAEIRELNELNERLNAARAHTGAAITNS